MNRQQYLLCKLAEEASEIAQIALKTQQFGFYETHPQLQETNVARIKAELTDLLAIVSLLNEEFGFSFSVSPEYSIQSGIEVKKQRVAKYHQYSIDLGETH